MKDLVQAVNGYLFAERGTSVYALLDGASVAGLLDKLCQYQPEYECLYRGELKPDLAEVAPYLVLLDSKSAFSDWVIGQGWGKHWGIFAVSRGDLRELRQHFRKLLTVYDPDGKPLLFRYYDPRVLSVYLPTCNAEELKAMFGPVLCFIQESEDPELLLRFQADSGHLLKQDKLLENDK